MLRRVAGVERAASSGKDMTRAIQAIKRDLRKLEEARKAREAVELTVSYPKELPISAARDEIAERIRDHQVVVVCGETGSGKTGAFALPMLGVRARPLGSGGA